MHSFFNDSTSYFLGCKKLIPYIFACLFVFGATAPQWTRASSFTRFLDHTQRRTAVGRNPLDEWSARRRDLYLTTHNTHNRQTSMPPVGFELTISTGERPQFYVLDRAATGTGNRYIYNTCIFLSALWSPWHSIPVLLPDINSVCYFDVTSAERPASFILPDVLVLILYSKDM